MPKEEKKRYIAYVNENTHVYTVYNQPKKSRLLQISEKIPSSTRVSPRYSYISAPIYALENKCSEHSITRIPSV